MLAAELNEVIYALQVARRGKRLVSEASTALPSQAYRLNGFISKRYLRSYSFRTSRVC